MNNGVPTITSLSPPSAVVGSAGQTVTIIGTNFVSTSTVTYNSVAHTATFVDSTHLTISLSTGDLATAGAYPVVVTNPTPGGGTSNSVNFGVGNPIPAITSLSPSSALPGRRRRRSPSLVRASFDSTSTVTYNGVAHTAAFVDATHLTISLTTRLTKPRQGPTQ